MKNTLTDPTILRSSTEKSSRQLQAARDRPSADDQVKRHSRELQKYTHDRVKYILKYHVRHLFDLMGPCFSIRSDVVGPWRSLTDCNRPFGPFLGSFVLVAFAFLQIQAKALEASKAHQELTDCNLRLWQTEVNQGAVADLAKEDQAAYDKASEDLIKGTLVPLYLLVSLCRLIEGIRVRRL